MVLLPATDHAADTMPRYDPVRTCTDAAPSPDCIQGETDAREVVARFWPVLSPGARARCTRFADRRQSFPILSGCLEREAAIQR